MTRIGEEKFVGILKICTCQSVISSLLFFYYYYRNNNRCTILHNSFPLVFRTSNKINVVQSC